MSRIEASKMEGVMVSSSLLLLSMMSVSIQYLQIVLAEQEGMTTYCTLTQTQPRKSE